MLQRGQATPCSASTAEQSLSVYAPETAPAISLPPYCCRSSCKFMKSESLSSIPTVPTASHCAAELMDTIHPIMQFIRTEMRSQREPSLSVPQFRVLAFLSVHPGTCLSEVAEHLGVTKATASAMTDRLVQRGLVDRTEDPTERRQIMLKLTPTGIADLEQMQAATQQKITDLFSQLTPTELTAVSAGLKILGQVFKGSE